MTGIAYSPRWPAQGLYAVRATRPPTPSREDRTMTTHHLTSDDAGTYRPDSMGEGRRGITPEQRRELERLIDEHSRAAMTRATRYGVTGKHDEALAQRSMDTHRDLMHYLDEITDYSAAEAVM